MAKDDWLRWNHQQGGHVSRNAVRVLRTFWTLTNGTRTAFAHLCQHPLGFELRVVEGADDLRRSQVYRDTEAADRDATATFDRLRARGWNEMAS